LATDWAAPSRIAGSKGRQLVQQRRAVKAKLPLFQ
jgi:hypothetical protein